MAKESPTQKNSRQLERHCKGVANHWRIDIVLLAARNEGLTLDDITGQLHGNFKTISEHTRRLVEAGLLLKTYKGRQVAHTLSPYGKRFASFLQTFQHS